MTMCVNTYAGSISYPYDSCGINTSYSVDTIDKVFISAPPKVTVKKGKTCKMNATIVQSSYKPEKITYSIANKKIATVDKNGKITEKKKGTTKITGQLLGYKYRA